MRILIITSGNGSIGRDLVPALLLAESRLLPCNCAQKGYAPDTLETT